MQFKKFHGRFLVSSAFLLGFGAHAEALSCDTAWNQLRTEFINEKTAEITQDVKRLLTQAYLNVGVTLNPTDIRFEVSNQFSPLVADDEFDASENFFRGNFKFNISQIQVNVESHSHTFKSVSDFDGAQSLQYRDIYNSIGDYTGRSCIFVAGFLGTEVNINSNIVSVDSGAYIGDIIFLRQFLGSKNLPVTR